MTTTDADRPITIDDLLRVERVSDPEISPDGRWVVYAVATPDVEANTVRSQLWLAPTEGGPPRRVLEDPAQPETRRFLSRLLEGGRA